MLGDDANRLTVHCLDQIYRPVVSVGNLNPIGSCRDEATVPLGRSCGWSLKDAQRRRSVGGGNDWTLNHRRIRAGLYEAHCVSDRPWAGQHRGERDQLLRAVGAAGDEPAGKHAWRTEADWTALLRAGCCKAYLFSRWRFGV